MYSEFINNNIGRCDRLQPKCSKCTQQGAECHYELEHVAPKKRGRPKKNDNNRYAPYTAKQVAKSSNDKSNEANQKPGIENVIQDLIQNSPLFDHKKVADLLKISQLAGNELPSNSITNEDMALYHAFKGKRHIITY
jgi:hypothetical protein